MPYADDYVISKTRCFVTLSCIAFDVLVGCLLFIFDNLNGCLEF